MRTNNKNSIPSTVVLLIASVIVLFPLFWVLLTSLKSTQEFLVNIWGLPETYVWQNYTKAWEKTNFASNFTNSLFVTFGSMALSVTLSVTTAYVIARYKFRLNAALKGIYVAALMVPSIISLIPQYFMLDGMHLLDSRLGLIFVYGLAEIPFNVFMLLGFFQTIPHELEEAALVDGADHYVTFFRVMLPLAQPGIVTVSVVNFISFWNEYYKAMVFMSTPEKYTIPVSLVNYTAQCQIRLSWGPLMASNMLMIVPTIAVYCIFRKTIQAGLTAGAVKG